METVYPLKAPLPHSGLVPRLKELGPRLRAVRAWRTPDPKARLCVLAKDNISVRGFTTPAGSFALRNFELPESFCAMKLREAGIDLFGKTNMTELAGFVTANPVALTGGYSQLGGFGVNPHGPFPTRGSSSGSAVAVAAGLCDAALGTETRGSLMMPALACGAWAFKPSVGMVSRRGVVPISQNFDSVGVIARGTGTMEEVFDAMSGPDPEDPATELADRPSGSDLPEKLRIGVLRVSGVAASDTIQKAAIERLSRKGVEFLEITAPECAFDYKWITSVDIRRGMDALLGRYAREGTPRNFAELCRFYRAHPETHPYGMERLEDALKLPAPSEEEYERVVRRNLSRARNLITGLCRENGVTALLAPQFVDWWAIAGAPSIAVPLGTGPDGKPSGVILGMPRGEDRRLLRLASWFERLLSPESA